MNIFNNKKREYINNINETAKVVKLRINELPDSGWVKYLADQFLYKKNPEKRKKME